MGGTGLGTWDEETVWPTQLDTVCVMHLLGMCPSRSMPHLCMPRVLFMTGFGGTGSLKHSLHFSAECCLALERKTKTCGRLMRWLP